MLEKANQRLKEEIKILTEDYLKEGKNKSSPGQNSTEQNGIEEIPDEYDAEEGSVQVVKLSKTMERGSNLSSSIKYLVDSLGQKMSSNPNSPISQAFAEIYGSVEACLKAICQENESHLLEICFKAFHMLINGKKGRNRSNSPDSNSPPENSKSIRTTNRKNGKISQFFSPITMSSNMDKTKPSSPSKEM